MPEETDHTRRNAPLLSQRSDAESLRADSEAKLHDHDLDNLLDQLRHADRLATLGQVAAGVVHELNEPLGNILGFAELVKREPGLTTQTRQDVEKIIASTLHAREVVRRLMVFARRTPPKRHKVNLNNVVSEGLYFLEARCRHMGVELVRDLQTDLPEILGDSSQLYQVLVNLVVNAIQAMPGGGRLIVQTEASEASVTLIVSDTGIGMSPEVREKALQPFFTTKDASEGTGLGLAVVHGIVAAHGGTIHITSEEGCGARFEICLPREAVAAPVEECVAVVSEEGGTDA